MRALEGVLILPLTEKINISNLFIQLLTEIPIQQSLIHAYKSNGILKDCIDVNYPLVALFYPQFLTENERENSKHHKCLIFGFLNDEMYKPLHKHR